MSAYVLGIDVGSSAVKTILISDDGQIVDESNVSHDLISLHPTWAEEDADIWWKNVQTGVKEIADRHPDLMPSVKAIGCSGMVPAIVLLDKNMRPVRKTIQQQDARSVEQIEKLSKAIDQNRLYERTGGYTNQQHILPRLLWVKENEPEVWEKVTCVMGSYDWIVYQLTGIKSLEMNWAVESGSLDIHTQQWITEDLEAFGINPEILPQVNPSMKVVGHVKKECESFGLPAGIPVIAGSADHIASSLSAGIIDSGDLLIKFGTAGDILYCIDDLKTCPKLFFDYSDVPGKYILNGCMASSGALVKWYTNDILESSSKTILKELDIAAEKLPAASDGLIILPYFVGEKTPIFDPNARGVMFGLTLSHTKAHIFRAVLESVIYGFRHHIEVVEELGFKPKQIIATNGGSKSRFWCQIASDVLGKPIRSYPHHPGSALGVAFLAGKSVGVFQDWHEVTKFLTEFKEYTPNPEAIKVYNKSYKLYRDLYETLKSTFPRIGDFYKD